MGGLALQFRGLYDHWRVAGIPVLRNASSRAFGEVSAVLLMNHGQHEAELLLF